MALINAFLLEKFFNISGNLIVHINLVARFLYSNIIHILAIIVNIVISVIITMRLLNILRLCALFKWHYKQENKKDTNDVVSACQFQVLIYIVWLLINFMIIILKIISINFAYRSHVLVKKLTKRKRRKKRDQQ